MPARPRKGRGSGLDVGFGWRGVVQVFLPCHVANARFFVVVRAAAVLHSSASSYPAPPASRPPRPSPPRSTHPHNYHHPSLQSLPPTPQVILHDLFDGTNPAASLSPDHFELLKGHSTPSAPQPATYYLLTAHHLPTTWPTGPLAAVQPARVPSSRAAAKPRAESLAEPRADATCQRPFVANGPPVHPRQTAGSSKV